MGWLMSAITTSWKTTVGGLLTFLVLLFGQASKLFDDDPKTNPDYNEIVAGAVLFATLISARDNNVTSEKAGAK